VYTALLLVFCTGDSHREGLVVISLQLSATSERVFPSLGSLTRKVPRREVEAIVKSTSCMLNYTISWGRITGADWSKFSNAK
jgi:hypothetical protein